MTKLPIDSVCGWIDGLAISVLVVELVLSCILELGPIAKTGGLKSLADIFLVEVVRLVYFILMAFEGDVNDL